MIPDGGELPLQARNGMSELSAQLRQADEETLDRLLAERAGEIDPMLTRQLFRNPYLEVRHLVTLAGIPRLISAYGFRRDLVGHPRTPRPLALQHVGGLYWADLVRIGGDTRLHPVVRRAADRRLIERLPALSIGERIAIGRAASAQVLGAMRLDPAPRVIAAMLENPRLTEGLVLPLALDERAAPQVLAKVARNRRWGVRIGVRRALCRNPATPTAEALRLLPTLAAAELATIATDSRLSPIVRRRARDLAASRS